MKLGESGVFFLLIPLFACAGGEDVSFSKDIHSDSGTAVVDGLVLNHYEEKGGFVVEDYIGNQTEITIPKEASSQPETWYSQWNHDGRPVVWGATREQALSGESA